MAKNKTAKKPKTKTDGGSEDTPPTKGPGLVSQLIIAVALGGASFATVMFLPDRTPQTVVQAEHHEDTADPLETLIPGPDDVYFVPLSDMTLSLVDLDRILKIGITLEVLYDSDVDIDPDDPALKDAFMGYLRSLRVEQLQDPAFTVRMRDHLLRRAQLVYDTKAIHGIMITDFLVR